MTSGTFETLTAQAWNTYKSVAERPESDLKTLSANYDSFIKCAKSMDTLTPKLNVDTPTKADADSAMSQVSIMDSALCGLQENLTKFEDSDTTAITKAATLDQASLRDKYNKIEQYDQEFAENLGGILYQCQLLAMGASIAVS